MSLGRRGFLPCQNPDVYSSYHDYRHGIKPSAWHRVRSPHGHRNDGASYDYQWDEWHLVYRISKCWKDQRGKGRNKRTTQYRPVSK